jgi:O-antigen ligase
VVSGAVAVAIYGLVARLVLGDKLYGMWSVPTVAPFGPFVSKNHFAGYVEMAALLAAGVAAGLTDEARRKPGWLSWIESRRAKWVVLAWGAVAVLVLAVPVSLSRGGVVSLAAGLLVFAGVRLAQNSGSRAQARDLVMAGAALALGFTTLAVVLPQEAKLRILTIAGGAREESGASRLAVWRDTRSLIASSPWVGSGFGAFGDALPRFKTAAGEFRIEHAENDYLETAAEGGVAGVLAAGAAIALLLAGGLVGIRRQSGLLPRAILASALAGIVTLLVHSAFDFNLRIPSNALLASFLAAFLGACEPGVRPEPPVRRRGLVVVRRFVSPVCLSAAALATTLVTSWEEPRWEPAALGRAVAPSHALRRASLDLEVSTFLRRRPAQATAWIQLGWLRLRMSREEARALVCWGLSLDPEHRTLRRAAAPLLEDGVVTSAACPRATSRPPCVGDAARRSPLP